MFLDLAHTRLEVFKVTREFVLECYKQTKDFPPEEKFGMVSQIRRAAVSSHLNLAEGSSRKTQAERNRFYEVSRSSIVEVDTAFALAIGLAYTTKEKLEKLGVLLVTSFKLVNGMISRN